MGIIPKALARGNIIGKTNREEIVVINMHECLIVKIEQADAFISLLGRLGTRENFFTIASWAQLIIHKKPIGLLDVNHYYGLLTLFLDSTMRYGFISSKSRRFLV